jgi:hypothetical protein
MHPRPRSNSLHFQAFNIRTKTGVVRLRQRKGPARNEKRPEVGLEAAARGSDNLPGTAAFCAIRAGRRVPKKNVPDGETGGGKPTGR